MLDFRGTNYPLGIRSNNPGNLEDSVDWLGDVSTSGRFDVFTSIEYGIRALMYNARTIYNRGNTSVKKLISIWAPLNDNNPTGSYIKYVANKMKVDPDKPFAWTKSNVIKLAEGIAFMENGASAGVIPFSSYNKAWNLLPSHIKEATEVKQKKGFNLFYLLPLLFLKN